jgi:glutamate-1-semialdehyde 2,1-aminomutase
MNDLSPTIDSALAQAVAAFVAKRPKTAALHARACAVMPGGNTRTVLFSAPFPIRVASSNGAHLTDVDGNSYVDFVGEYSAGIFGHTHARIRKAIEEAVAFGLNIGAQHEREITFAEAVTKRFDLERVRFTNSGTEANMMALAATRHFTKRGKIMPMHGGYHGGTLYFSHGASPVNAPFECVLGHFNDVDATRALIAEHANDLAAVILEPMLGGGGCIPASKEFLSMLREETSQRGIVLIFDEVMTSRLHPGGLSAQHAIRPDLKTLGKYIGGGMSFGAFGGRADIMDLFDPARPDALPHAGTFNNNTLTMTTGQMALTEIFTPAVCVALNQRGDTLSNQLNHLFMHYQAPMQTTGMGSLFAIHPKAGQLTTPEQVDECDVRLKRLLYLHLLDHGVYIAERGFIALSLAIDDAACDALLLGVESFLKTHSRLLLQAQCQ